jgi:hypothetical protein
LIYNHGLINFKNIIRASSKIELPNSTRMVAVSIGIKKAQLIVHVKLGLSFPNYPSKWQETFFVSGQLNHVEIPA